MILSKRAQSLDTFIGKILKNTVIRTLRKKTIDLEEREWKMKLKIIGTPEWGAGRKRKQTNNDIIIEENFPEQKKYFFLYIKIYQYV